MIRLVISNQRGGVAKTTTTTTVARILADRGYKVLIIDTDPQGSVASILGLRPQNYLYQFIIANLVFEDCIVKAHPNIDVMCSNRQTVEAEAMLMATVAREMVFLNMFSPVETPYDVVLIDVSPSINLLQTCSMVYARQILVPVAMDALSFQGATASIETAKSLNRLLKTNIQTMAMLPVMVHRRMAMTEMVLTGLTELSGQTGIPLLPAIRTDTAVNKAARQRQFVVDFDAKSRALEDYVAATDQLLEVLEGKRNVQIGA
jgi:chromosome partitioning protein